MAERNGVKETTASAFFLSSFQLSTGHDTANKKPAFKQRRRQRGEKADWEQLDWVVCAQNVSQVIANTMLSEICSLLMLLVARRTTNGPKKITKIKNRQSACWLTGIAKKTNLKHSSQLVERSGTTQQFLCFKIPLEFVRKTNTFDMEANTSSWRMKACMWLSVGGE